MKTVPEQILRYIWTCTFADLCYFYFSCATTSNVGKLESYQFQSSKKKAGIKICKQIFVSRIKDLKLLLHCIAYHISEDCGWYQGENSRYHHIPSLLLDICCLDCLFQLKALSWTILTFHCNFLRSFFLVHLSVFSVMEHNQVVGDQGHRSYERLICTNPTKTRPRLLNHTKHGRFGETSLKKWSY